MGYRNFRTIPLEDESHGQKKLAGQPTSASASCCPPVVHVVQNICTVLSSLLLSSMELPLSPSDSRVRKPLSARVHRHTGKSAATCCEIPTSESRSLSPSPPSAEVQVKRRELSGCDKTFADVLSRPSDVFEPSNQGQETKSTINQTCSTSHPCELSVETPRAVQATTCRRNT